MAGRIDARVIAVAAPGTPARAPGFRLLAPLRPAPLGRALLPLRLGLATAAALRAGRYAAVVAESPHFGALALLVRALTPGRRPAVIVEVHGDWRAATRLYGSPARRVLSPLADRLAAAALRRADAVRAISAGTAALVEEAGGREPDVVFPTFTDLSAFDDRPPLPLPAVPTALFVGALEPVKDPDALLAAWPAVRRRVPDARLIIVGDGSRRAVAERLRAAGAEWIPRTDAPGVARLLDQATTLVLPSRSEGLGRVIIEAAARGRPAVASAVGGIPELVAPGVSGLLVPPGEPAALAAALVEVLGDPERAALLAAGATAAYAGMRTTPGDYAQAYARLTSPP